MVSIMRRQFSEYGLNKKARRTIRASVPTMGSGETFARYFDTSFASPYANGSKLSNTIKADLICVFCLAKIFQIYG